MCSCCSEDQPTEVKLTAAKVLVDCAATVLSSPHLPLGESQLHRKCLPPVDSDKVKLVFQKLKEETFKISSSDVRVCVRACTCVCVCVCVRSVHYSVSVEESLSAAAG